MRTRPERMTWFGLLIVFLTFAGSTCVATTAIDTTIENSSETELLELAKKRFNNDIRPAEDTLFRASSNGRVAYCDNGSIRADCLVWLCTDKKAAALVTFRGVRVSGATIEGTVDLEWATISFPLQVVSCKFTDPIILKNSSLFGLSFEGTEIQDLEAERLMVKGNVFLRDGFKAYGEVRLERVKIGEDLDCRGAQFLNRSGIGLDFESATIDGHVFLNGGFKSFREVFLAGAKIGGDLDCRGGHFWNTAGRALNLASATIGGRVFLNSSRQSNFEAREQVCLTGAKIGGALDCAGGKFQSSEKFALQADYVDVAGTTYLTDDFVAEGGVALEYSSIEGNLNCAKGRFRKSEKQPFALELRSTTIADDAHLDNGFRAEGVVSLRDARIEHEFILENIDWSDKIILDLRFAKVGTLHNGRRGWPANGNLRLNGFAFDVIDSDAGPDACTQLQWVDKQWVDKRSGGFLSQPYEQLASTLRGMGLQEEAVKVLIAKNEDQGRQVMADEKNVGNQGKELWDWFWYNAFGKFIGYGYRPWNALFASLLVIGFGTVLFKIGYLTKSIIPTADDAYYGGTKQLRETYPKFNTLIYALETFVPLVKLKVDEYWMPDANRGPVLIWFDSFPLLTVGGLFRCYLWFHILAGWLLTTLWVGGLTGLLKT
jgi:hypothetical protein